jgi:putative transposase
VVRRVRRKTVLPQIRKVWQVSERRACYILDIDRKMLHDTSIKRDDPVLRKRIREIAWSRVRSGARRRGVLLRREGWVVNHKRVRRMYREEGLAIRTESPKGRRATMVREVGVLRRPVAERGKPQRITCDNGPEFVSLQLDQWAYWTSPSTS